MMAEERPEQDNIDDETYDKYIGTGVIMDTQQSGIMLKTWIKRKWVRIIGNPSWILESTSWNMMMGPIIATLPMLFLITYIHR